MQSMPERPCHPGGAGPWTALAQELPGPVTATALAGLLTAAEGRSGIAEVPAEGLLDVLVAAERLVAWGQSLSLAVVDELVHRLDRPLPADDPPHPQAPDLSQEVSAEIACLLATSNAAAQAKVQLARRLRRLPAVADALARGEIDLAKARVIAEETDHLDPDTATETADRALGEAGLVPPARLRARCRAAALAADPDATRERRERNRRTGRDVTLQPGRDGLACVSAVLTEAEAADLYARVQHAAEALLAADRAAGEKPRRIAAARADALLALTHLAGGHYPRPGAGPDSSDAGSSDAGSSDVDSSDVGSSDAGSSDVGSSDVGSSDVGSSDVDSSDVHSSGGAQRDDVDVAARAGHPGAMVGITVPLGALLAGFSGPCGPPGSGDEAGDDDPAWQLSGLDRFALGEITGIGPVSAEEAADACLRACARALKALAAGEPGGRVGVRFIVTDHTGRAVATTGTSYTIPPLLRAAVEARDRTCRFPGCNRPAVRCDLDHVVPYPEGDTTLGNLAALCRHHHRLKTHGDWRTRLDDSGEQAWSSPLGRVHRTTPATWGEPYDLPDQLALPPDHDLDIWPDDPGWLDRLAADALQGVEPGALVLAG